MEQLQKLKEIIDNSNNIVFFGGAGVSTESNIPDFRSDTGLYKQKKYGYNAEEILSRTFFNNHKDIFYKFYFNEMLYPNAKPNKAHLALATLEKIGKLKAVITQNIDGLHQDAGSKNVIELHGSVRRNHCIKCRGFYNEEEMIKYQGYAFYYQDENQKITKVNGKLADINSTDISFDTDFRLASVSKQFIAYGIIRLVENKLLKYDTTIKEIFNDLPEYFNKITVKHLLTHTSGIYDYETIPHKDDDKQILDRDILTFLQTTTKTYFEPGSKYQYSNTGFILLGLIIEEVSKEKIAIYLGKIFKEVGMANTMVNYQGITEIPNRAYGHIIENGKLIVKDQYWCSATIGDGGIYSNINDLNKWIDYLLKNETKLKSTMFKINTLNDGTKTEYGYGMQVVEINNKLLYYHCGDTIGTNTLIMFSNDFKLRCIFLTNLGSVETRLLKDAIVEEIKNKF